MRLSSCISLDLLYVQNGDEPSENCKGKVHPRIGHECPEGQ